MIDPSDLWHDLLRLALYHLRKIAVVVTAVCLLVLLVSVVWLLAMPFYVATTTVTFLPTQGELALMSSGDEFRGVSPAITLSQTHTEFLLSRELSEEVVREVFYDDQSSTNGSQQGGAPKWAKDTLAPAVGGLFKCFRVLNCGFFKEPDPFDSLVARLQGRIEAKSVPGSYVMAVSVTWPKPEIAARAANVLAKRYVGASRAANQAEMRLATEYIEERIQEAGAALRAKEQELADYKDQSHLYALDEETSLDLSAISTYEQELNLARVALADVSTRIAKLKDYRSESGLIELQAQEAGLQAKIESFQEILKKEFAALESLPQAERRYVDMYRGKAQMEGDLRKLQDELLETKISEAAQLSAIRVIDRAKPPVYPDQPMVLVNVIAAAIVGMFLAAGLVLVQEYASHYIRTPEDLGALGAFCIGKLPYKKNPGVAGRDAGSSGKRRGLRRWFSCGRDVARRHMEHLLLTLLDTAESRPVMFVSPGQGDGKSYVIGNLMSLLKARNTKALVIDADMVKPVLHRFAGQPNEGGLAAVLNDFAPLSSVVVNAGGNVDFICAGAKGEEPFVQANTVERVRRELRQLAADYELVLIEAPPSRKHPGARRLWRITDEIVCVVDTTRTTRRELAALLKETRLPDKNAAVVLNKLKYPGDFVFGA